MTKPKFVRAFWSDVRNSLYPYPVYEAHFSDGSVYRASFWSHKDKPLNVENGKHMATPSDEFLRRSGRSIGEFVEGFVEWDNGDMTDPNGWHRMTHAEAAVFSPNDKPIRLRANASKAREIVKGIPYDPKGVVIPPDKWKELIRALAA